jgi:hypothetical protein
MPFPSTYPATADGFPINRATDDILLPDDINGLADAINKIETDLLATWSVKASRYGWSTTASGAVNATALAAAVSAVATLGAGEVLLGPGDYNLASLVTVPSKVRLRGTGIDATRILSTVAGRAIKTATGAVQVEFVDFTIVAPTTGDNAVPLALDELQGGRVMRMRCQGGTAYGLEVFTSETSTSGLFTNNVEFLGVWITGVRHGSTYGGAGLWIYRGVNHCRFVDVYVNDTDGVGVQVDAGTSTGTGTPCTFNQFTNLQIRNYGQGGNGQTTGRSGLVVEGCSDNQFDTYLIEGTAIGTTPEYGIYLNVDQHGASSDRNRFSNGVLDGLQGRGVQIEGGSANVWHGLTAHNVNVSATAGHGQAINVVGKTNGSVAHDASDNAFYGVKVIQDVAYAANYQWLLFCNDDAVNNVFRNRVILPQAGAPAFGILGATNATREPLVGVNANSVLVLQTDDTGDGVGLYLGASRDVRLVRDGVAGVLGLRNTGQAQLLRLYDTYTDVNNWSRLEIGSVSGEQRILSNALGAPAIQHLKIGTIGAAHLYFRTSGTDRWLVHSGGALLAQVDATYDIGAAGASRPRNGYFSGGVAVFDKAGAPVDGDFASPVNGMIAADHTNNKLWVRLGGTWKGVVVA